MKNTENTTAPLGHSRSALTEALRDVASNRYTCLVVHPLGWYAVSPALVDVTEELPLLDYERLIDATPNELPEGYTEETFEDLAEWVETNVQDWLREAIDWECERIEREEAHRAQVEQRPVNHNATTWRLGALCKCLANLKRA